MIASVPNAAGKYNWDIPTNLKNASSCQIRVWGDHQPTCVSDGMSPQFSIVNDIPNAVTQFVVLSTSSQQPCEAGKKCAITWDYNPHAVYPASVSIDLYQVGSKAPVQHIATVSSRLKQYEWNVPKDAALTKGQFYISVNGQGVPLPGPGQGNDMGANSAAFAIQEPKPEEQEKNDKKDTKQQKIKDPRRMESPVEDHSDGVKNAGTHVSTKKLSLAVVTAVAIVRLLL
jgi:hypothetical protein